VSRRGAGAELVWNDSAFQSRLRERMRRILLAIAQRFEELLQEAFRRPKHGRIYRRKGGVVHQASAPGEAPAIDTGRESQSIGRRSVNVTGGAGVVVEVGSSIAKPPYPRYLESPGDPAKAHPAWGPALEALRRECQSVIAREISHE
jgi:hypothetical protein